MRFLFQLFRIRCFEIQMYESTFYNEEYLDTCLTESQREILFQQQRPITSGNAELGEPQRGPTYPTKRKDINEFKTVSAGISPTTKRMLQQYNTEVTLAEIMLLPKWALFLKRGHLCICVLPL